jgi:hypothetical protein
LCLEKHDQSCPGRKRACRALVAVVTRDSLPGLAKEARYGANVWMEGMVSTVFVQGW